MLENRPDFKLRASILPYICTRVFPFSTSPNGGYIFINDFTCRQNYSGENGDFIVLDKKWSRPAHVDSINDFTG